MASRGPHGKLYRSIFDSSVMEEDVATRLVWVFMLALGYPDGEIDATVPALARRFNMPAADVERAIGRLSEPDPNSRSPEAEGRRLVPLDSERGWGWQIVNYAAYRDHRDRSEYQKRYYQEKIKPKRQAPRRDLESQPVDSVDSTGQQAVNRNQPIQRESQKKKESKRGRAPEPAADPREWFPVFTCQLRQCQPSGEEIEALLEDLAELLPGRDTRKWLEALAAESAELRIDRQPEPETLCLWIVGRARAQAAKSRKAPYQDQVAEVFAAYQKHKAQWYELLRRDPPRKATLTKPQAKEIAAHLRNGRTVEDLVAALANVQNSAYHMKGPKIEGRYSGAPRLSISDVFKLRTNGSRPIDSIEILLDKTKKDRDLSAFGGGGYL